MRLRFRSRAWPRAAAVVASALVIAVGGFPPAAVAASASAPAAGDTVRFLLTAPGDTLWLSAPIEVTGDRVPAALPGVLRPVAVRDADALARLPAWSTADALAQAPGVEVRQRQLFGAQADLSIRGSTFEQVQVLLDGVDVGDPQTGHHSLNLPLGAGDVGRLEVLRGHGSVLFGGNAFGGAVNVIPRAPAAEAGGELGLTGGNGGTWGARASLDLPAGGALTRVSAERLRADGDRPGTDARHWTATGRALFPAAGGEGDLFVGLAEREFGARDFYSPFPSWERTRTVYGAARWRRGLSERASLDARLHARHHADRFVLVRDDPDRYANDHDTDVYGGELRVAGDLPAGLKLAGGLAGGREELHSVGTRRVDGAIVVGPALGTHARRLASGSLELSAAPGALRWSLGSRLELHSGWKARVLGTAAAAWDAGGGATVRASAGSVWRAPTFTELYYVDPVNLGSAALAPERGWSWDAGADLRRGGWTLGATFFARRERELIDWVRPVAAGSAWVAANIGSGSTLGTETELTWAAPQGHLLAVRHAWYDRERDLPAAYEAKYAQLAPRHLLAAEAAARLPAGLALTLVARWRDGAAPGGDPVLVDARLAWRAPAWTLSVQGTNLADRDYAEVPGVPLPGRLVAATVARAF